jgi:excisionase family DNA binding protein
VGFDSHSSEPAFDSAVPLGGSSLGPLAPLLDSKGAAALLNVPASWVLAEARADRIPHVRLGRYVRFDAAELQTWWLSRRRGPWRSGGHAAETARVVTGQIERAA